jgi:hypothetical protein
MTLITYDLKLHNGERYSVSVDIEREHPSPEALVNSKHSEWTRLGHHQCKACPLDPAKHKFCPTAVDIEEIAHRFFDTMSTDSADVTVHTRERNYSKRCDAQTYLMSLFGLIMATSACPVMGRLKPLAYFHLPFSSLEETIYRLVGAYLTNQYLVRKAGQTPDWDLDGLRELYTDLNQVNRSFMQRLRSASTGDANVNAQQIFISVTRHIEMGIDAALAKLAPKLNGL